MMPVRAATAAMLVSVCVATVGIGEARGAPSLAQLADASVGSGPAISATFSEPTTAGNLIVAYVVWDNTSPVTVTDSAGNVYEPAGADRTAWAGDAYGAQVFYAKNVRGGVATVTATFDAGVSSFGLLYVHEYRGIDRIAPLDAASAAQGASTAMDSGRITTTVAGDLLFGAGSSVGAVTKGGTGFAVQSMAYGNLIEDGLAPAAGSYAATATHTGGGWVLQVVAFRAEAAGPPDTLPPTRPMGLTATAVSSSRIDLAWSAANDNVGVTGYTIYRDGQAIGTTNGVAYQDTGLSASTTYTYAVGARDAAGNSSPLSVAVSATTEAPPDPTSCALPNYPTPECTGVPAGTTFVRVIDGTYTARTPGEVIDRWHIKGSLIVEADNVLISNSQIDDTVSNDAGNGRRPFTIVDSTVGPETCGTPVWMPNGVGFDQYTAIRVRVRGHEDGFRASGPNVTIRDSYYRPCVTPEGHADGVQDYPAAQNLVVEHNTFDMSNLPGGYTAPVFVASVDTRDVRLTDNLLLGGVYTLFTRPLHGTWIVTGNRVVERSWAFGAYETYGFCDNVTTWSDNTIVTIDDHYRLTSTLRTEPCPQ